MKPDIVTEQPVSGLGRAQRKSVTAMETAEPSALPGGAKPKSGTLANAGKVASRASLSRSSSASSQSRTGKTSGTAKATSTKARPASMSLGGSRGQVDGQAPHVGGESGVDTAGKKSSVKDASSAGKDGVPKKSSSVKTRKPRPASAVMETPPSSEASSNPKPRPSSMIGSRSLSVNKTVGRPGKADTSGAVALEGNQRKSSVSKTSSSKSEIKPSIKKQPSSSPAPSKAAGKSTKDKASSIKIKKSSQPSPKASSTSSLPPKPAKKLTSKPVAASVADDPKVKPEQGPKVKSDQDRIQEIAPEAHVGDAEVNDDAADMKEACGEEVRGEEVRGMKIAAAVEEMEAGVLVEEAGSLDSVPPLARVVSEVHADSETDESVPEAEAKDAEDCEEMDCREDKMKTEDEDDEEDEDDDDDDDMYEREETCEEAAEEDMDECDTQRDDPDTEACEKEKEAEEKEQMSDDDEDDDEEDSDDDEDDIFCQATLIVKPNAQGSGKREGLCLAEIASNEIMVRRKPRSPSQEIPSPQIVCEERLVQYVLCENPGPEKTMKDNSNSMLKRAESFGERDKEGRKSPQNKWEKDCCEKELSMKQDMTEDASSSDESTARDEDDLPTMTVEPCKINVTVNMLHQELSNGGGKSGRLLLDLVHSEDDDEWVDLSNETFEDYEQYVSEKAAGHGLTEFDKILVEPDSSVAPERAVEATTSDGDAATPCRGVGALEDRASTVPIVAVGRVRPPKPPGPHFPGEAGNYVKLGARFQDATASGDDTSEMAGGRRFVARSPEAVAERPVVEEENEGGPKVGPVLGNGCLSQQPLGMGLAKEKVVGTSLNVQPKVHADFCPPHSNDPTLFKIPGANGMLPEKIPLNGSKESSSIFSVCLGGNCQKVFPWGPPCKAPI
ncbi:uncharacterized protein LOC116953182 isoform X1 [Petromyzon marinus]|uniref:uncharacterized protein LOC116953182 isoform X1 n=2 Tax=Petromyzon marinus TaxID=7757 RepID=UPI003F7029DC